LAELWQDLVRRAPSQVCDRPATLWPWRRVPGVAAPTPLCAGPV